VLSAIDFDDEAPFAADKINNETSDGVLPDEFMTVQRAGAEVIPQLQLRIGRVAA